MKRLKAAVAALHLITKEILEKKYLAAPNDAFRGETPNILEGDFHFVAQEEVKANEK